MKASELLRELDRAGHFQYVRMTAEDLDSYPAITRLSYVVDRGAKWKQSGTMARGKWIHPTLGSAVFEITGLDWNESTIEDLLFVTAGRYEIVEYP